MRWYGCFLIGHCDGVALGCGGIRLLGWNTAEIERMYVAEPRVASAGAGTSSDAGRPRAHLRSHPDPAGNRRRQPQRPEALTAR